MAPDARERVYVYSMRRHAATRLLRGLATAVGDQVPLIETAVRMRV